MELNEYLAGVKEWENLSKKELMVAVQAMFLLASHADCPQWVRDSAEALKKDFLS